MGGLFSVTLSVTRDLHPGYPRFHEACRPPVFGLSSGEKNFSQRSSATVAKLPWSSIEIQQDTGSESAILDETEKNLCLFFGSHFSGFSARGVGEKSLARRGKTNIVHAPLRLAE